MSKVVLDASALIAYLREERGWDVVGPVVRGAMLSTVNFSEVMKKAVERGGSSAKTATMVRLSQIELVDFDAEQARFAADLWPAGKPWGLSLADRACVALGMKTGATVYTAEENMTKLDVPVKFVLIRRRQ